MIDASGTYYIHADHLNTPRHLYDASANLRWRWDQDEPFGVNAADEDPSSLGAVALPLRFPGQYADKETNLHYNYFRDYDSALGRYVESDPIGLKGGVNTYLYTAAVPLAYSDPQGLFIQGLIARIGLQTIGSKWGNTPLENGAEHERLSLFTKVLAEYEACIDACSCEPFSRQFTCEDTCVRRYKKRLEDIVFGQ